MCVYPLSFARLTPSVVRGQQFDTIAQIVKLKPARNSVTLPNFGGARDTKKEAR
jgi:hypothetical protein